MKVSIIKSDKIIDFVLPPQVHGNYWITDKTKDGKDKYYIDDSFSYILRDDEKDNIILIGFMGCGKSTMARLLSETTGAKLIEMDETIEADAGMTINEIFEAYGETHFRDLETKLIRRIAEEGGAVVSCGGGAILRPENVACMKENGKIIYLSATPETIFQRVRHSTNRPLLNGNMNVEYISSLMEKRLPHYLAAADITIVVDDREKQDVLNDLLKV